MLCLTRHLRSCRGRDYDEENEDDGEVVKVM